MNTKCHDLETKKNFYLQQNNSIYIRKFFILKINDNTFYVKEEKKVLYVILQKRMCLLSIFDFSMPIHLDA